MARLGCVCLICGLLFGVLVMADFSLLRMPLLSSRSSSANQPSGDSLQQMPGSRSWNNLRFMKTFFRVAGQDKQSPSALNTFSRSDAKNQTELILNNNYLKFKNGYKERNNESNKGLSSFIITTEKSSGIDMTKIRSQSSQDVKKEKKDDDKKDNVGLISYLGSFFYDVDDNLKNISSIKNKHEEKSDELFYLNKKMLEKNVIKILNCEKTLAIISVNEQSLNQTITNCELFDLDKRAKEADDLMKKLKLHKVEVSFLTMMGVIEECKNLSKKIHAESIRKASLLEALPSSGNNISQNESIDSINIFQLNSGIVPGTVWCGLGDNAKSYNDLGPNKNLDICCRAHDHCPIRLKSFKSGYGIVNFSIYTKSHCQCDKDFYNCLREINNKSSNMIGNLFFNVFKLKCIDDNLTCINTKNEAKKKECAKENTMIIKNPQDY